MLVSLNFLPFNDPNPNITVTIYRKKYSGELRKDGFFVGKLPEHPDRDWPQYHISLSPLDNYEPYEFSVEQNPQLMTSIIWYLYERKIENEYSEEYEIIGYYQRRISFVVEVFPEGNRVVKISPYYLRSKKLIGFIFEFDFSKKPGVKYGRKIQELSFSLDKRGKSNANSYLDKLDYMQRFIRGKFAGLMGLVIEGKELRLSSEFVKLEARELKDRVYIFGDGIRNNNKIEGVTSKPYQLPQRNPFYIFVFRQDEKQLGNELYKALVGRTYHGTFPGMKERFHIDFNSHNVSSINIDLNKNGETTLQRSLEVEMNRHPNEQLIGLFIDSYSDEKAYIKAKYAFLKMGIPLQVVRKTRILATEGLKWAASGIGLQMFCKLGGIPWIVQPSTEDCLIFGIGTAHEREKTEQGFFRIRKYYAYSVCLDSTGKYLSLGILGEDNDNRQYITALKDNIEAFIADQIKKGTDVKHCVIHTPFKLRYDEMRAIKDSLNEIRRAFAGIKFLVIKINTRNRFFGFADNNLKVPYESSYIQLSQNEYVMWFEGLAHGREYINKRIANPTHIQFLYPSWEEMKDMKGTWEVKERLLQDIVNLAGASWRGFNAKLEPTSIFYPELIARFIRDFRGINKQMESNMFSIEAPWFL